MNGCKLPERKKDEPKDDFICGEAEYRALRLLGNESFSVRLEVQVGAVTDEYLTCPPLAFSSPSFLYHTLISLQQ